MEQSQRKLQNEMESLSEKIHKSYIRKQMERMFECSLKCVRDESASTQQVEQCTYHCAEPLQHLSAAIDGEMQDFQQRLNRCGTSCQDKVRDRFAGRGDSSDTYIQQQEIMNTCLSGCIDEQIAAMSSLEARIKSHCKKFT